MNARDYLSLVRERKLLIAVCLVLGVVAAAVVTSLIPKVYTSTSTYYLVAGATAPPQAAPSSDSYQGAQLAMARVKSYKELIMGMQVATDAASRLGTGVAPAQVRSKVVATSVEDTVVLTVDVSDNSALGAHQTAEAVSESFLALVDQLERPAFGDAQPAVRTKVVQTPTRPVAPTNPQLKINLVIGFVIGLLIGLGIAIGRRSLDVSVRTSESLAAITGVPNLGVVPEDRATADEPVALAARDGSGPGEKSAARAEAYRRIRTALAHANAQTSRSVLVVVGAQSGDGVTITACNLATAFAAIGSKVVLVDANLRNPMTAQYLRLDDRVGLTNVLTGEAGIWRAVQTWTPGRFDVLVSGHDVEQPNELLSSPQVRRLFADLRTRYDYVIVDTAPFLPTVDAANIGAHADGAILVSRWAKTSRDDAESAVEFLRSLSIPVVGSVLSRTPSGARDETERRRRLGRRRRPSSSSRDAVAREAAATAAQPTVATGFPVVGGPPSKAQSVPLPSSPVQLAMEGRPARSNSGAEKPAEGTPADKPPAVPVPVPAPKPASATSAAIDGGPDPDPAKPKGAAAGNGGPAKDGEVSRDTAAPMPPNGNGNGAGKPVSPNQPSGSASLSYGGPGSAPNGASDATMPAFEPVQRSPGRPPVVRPRSETPRPTGDGPLVPPPTKPSSLPPPMRRN